MNSTALLQETNPVRWQAVATSCDEIAGYADCNNRIAGRKSLYLPLVCLIQTHVSEIVIGTVTLAIGFADRNTDYGFRCVFNCGPEDAALLLRAGKQVGFRRMGVIDGLVSDGQFGGLELR
jgi:hypothetical protein